MVSFFAQAQSSYFGLQPSGPTLDSILGISSHMTGMDAGPPDLEFELEKLREAGGSLGAGWFFLGDN